MKRYIGAIFILFFCGSLYAQKRMAKADTVEIKNKLQTFIRLYYKRTEIDSLAALCGFPFQGKAFYGNKSWKTAKQMKQELNEILMRSRFRQTNYSVQGLYQIKKRVSPFIKNKNYSCFQMLVHLPDIGDAENGSYVRFIFYVNTYKPFKIIGVEQEDAP